jgi:hypothetical protein
MQFGRPVSERDRKVHVLPVLAFNAFGRSAQSASAVAFVIPNQNSDGGFGDTIRTNASTSDALDTVWVAITSQEVQPGPLFSSFPSPIVFVGIIVAVGVVVVVSLVVNRRASNRTAASLAILAPISTYWSRK